MPNWTKEQVDAIYKQNSNIIVSAGAGSGKTAVLSERVLAKLKSNVSLKNLIILTFTNLAAREMKERIEKKIKDELASYPHFKEELDYIDQAIITTFDAYALFLVKKYSHILNIDKNIAIADNMLLEIKLDNIIDEVFEEKYKSSDASFIKLINEYTVKDDVSLKKCIKEYYKSINNNLNKDEYLKSYIDEYYNESKIDQDITSYLNLITKEITNIKNCIGVLNNTLTIEKEIKYKNDLYAYLCDLLDASTYEEIKESVFNLGRIPIIQKPSETLSLKKSEIGKSIESIKKLCKYDSISEMKSNIFSTKEYVSEIIDILNIVFTKMKEYKKENNLYEFIDIASLGIELLKNNEDIRLEIKNNINEIMIDEYQDTNDIQDVFISLISNNNVYMVGDVKQSIYRFRNANPKIFMKKYSDYSNCNGGIKIDLIKNFRSRSEVLENINEIFDYIMDENIGGAEYKRTHRLVFGNEEYTPFRKENYNLSIYNYEAKNNKNEIEAFIVARDIINKVNNKYQVYDKDLKTLRNVRYSDFAILIDRSRQFDLYRKVFEYMHIPLSVNKNDSFIHSDEMYVIINILKIIYSYKDEDYKKDNLKHSLMSVLRSFLFEYSDEDITKLMLEDNILDEISNDASIFNKIYKVTKDISDNLDYMTIDEVLNETYNSFDIKQKISKIGNYNNILVKLNYLTNKAKELSSNGYTLIDFINYIEYVINDKDKDIDFKADDTSDESVVIMTIHASKGLEYNICYYPELYKEFSKSDLQKQFMFSNNYGIIIPYVKDYIVNKTIYNDLIKDEYKKEEIGERLRLFYVALTRAKQKMIMLCPNFYEEESEVTDMVKDEIRMKYNSFRSVILSVQNKVQKYVEDIADISIDQKYKEHKEIKKINSTSKNTITHINLNLESTLINEMSFSKKIHELTSQETKDSMEYGTRVHKYLELMDISSNKITDTFKNKIKEIGINLDESTKYNEYEFMYESDSKIKHGVIDLLIDYNDKMYIIDYKLKNIDSDEYKEQLKGYKLFVESKTKKDVECYLYSIVNNTLEKIL